MPQRMIQWVDPITNEPLIEQNGFFISKTGKYEIKNDIPNFVTNLNNEGQKQVKDGFSYKWEKALPVIEDSFYNENLKDIYSEMMGLSDVDLSIFKNKIILDIGVGSGSSARMWGSISKEFHGIDISTGVYKAKNTLKDSISNLVLAQADLNKLPYPDNSFDVIVSNGVLHHTPNTKDALKNIIKKLKSGGSCLFYIYKKKSPIREFSDDYIRSKICDLHPDSALEQLKPITEFAKSIHEKSIQIEVPEDIPILEIKKGKYDLQLFFYQHFFKCFWNDKFGFDISNLTNFDWYYPKFSWRHTSDEINQWCKEFQLEIKFIKETMSGYACLALKK
jgi:ubiquinone/menaquinone biosynthesis C-methylase UbiE